MKVVEDLSAGGVVYRLGHRAGAPTIEFLVGEQVDWRTGARNVRLPKGHLDPGETFEQAALREVAEETGRSVHLVGWLGEHRYHYDVPSKCDPVEMDHRVHKRVVFYLMRDEADHANGRDEEMGLLHWLDETEARARLTFENERAMIELARIRIESERQA